MIPLLERIRSTWKRVFFWHQTPSSDSSEEFVPHRGHDHALVMSVTSPGKIPRWKQLRFINRVLDTTERRIFWGATLVFVLAFVAGLIELGNTQLDRVPTTGGEYSEGLVGTPKLVNPLFAPTNDVDRDLVALLFSGLFRVDQDLNAQPDLAESYHWLEEGKTLEVKLRGDARFHDGAPVTADDVFFTYQSIKNPAWRSPLASIFHDVQLVRVDGLTIQFQLPKPDASFLNELTVGILPAHAWEEIQDTSARLADANLKPVGSGPYQAVSFTRDGRGNILSFQLKRFPAFYGLKPLIDEVRFRFYPDRKEALAALNNGQIDALAFVPWAKASEGRADHVRSVGIELPQETVAFFNTKNPLLKDEKLRQALTLAVDPVEVARVASDHAKPVTSPFPFLEDVSSTKPDLEAARAKLDALGWKLPEGETVRRFIPKGSSTTSTAASTTLAFTIDVPNQPDLTAVAEHLKRQWSLLGAQVEVQTGESEPLLRDAVANRSYQVLVWNVLVPPNQDLSAFWSSANASAHGLNLSNIGDRDIDAALEAIKNATTNDALKAAELKLSSAIRARSAALFLLRPTYALLIANRVMGVEDMRISRPSDRLLNIGRWYIEEAMRWK